ncbi:MAG: hypothetical protein SLAVMIC_00708 [uncultured marine phage]|uniref:Uncharacterized protein n=1 Tax=uncultured marine phage TaxID=707152 RepID=A0A8D9C9D4_9VIRU|nr:MAG: hypothetical protein SLAVMIC_00708 [uncultured marine phage]
MKLLKIFNRGKRKVIPRSLSPKELWCKRIVDLKGKYHKDVGKTVWYMTFIDAYENDGYIIAEGVIKAHHSSYEVDGTRRVMIVENSEGRYEEIGMYYFLSKPHDWYLKLDNNTRMTYREIQDRIYRYENISNGKTIFTKEIKHWKEQMDNLEPELTKDEFREKRLGKLLD